MNVRDLDTTHARLLDVAAAWGRLEESAQWYTQRIAERVHARGADPYELTFGELALDLAEVDLDLAEAAAATAEHEAAPRVGVVDEVKAGE